MASPVTSSKFRSAHTASCRNSHKHAADRSAVIMRHSHVNMDQILKGMIPAPRASQATRKRCVKMVLSSISVVFLSGRWMYTISTRSTQLWCSVWPFCWARPCFQISRNVNYQIAISANLSPVPLWDGKKTLLWFVSDSRLREQLKVRDERAN